MKIAVCDDNKKDLLSIVSLLESYNSKKNVNLQYFSFQNPCEMLESMTSDSYDIILLDVLMPMLNGIDTAKEIRTYDNNVKIIFLTSSPEFAVDSYSVDAHYYLLKPISSEKLFPILDRLFYELKKSEPSLLIKTPFSIFNVPFSKIEYLEVNSKILYFHLSDGSIREFAGKLSHYEQELSIRNGFIKTHRSYIVNLRCIEQLHQNSIVTYCGKTIPVSRAGYQTVCHAYIEFLFSDSENHI